MLKSFCVNKYLQKIVGHKIFQCIVQYTVCVCLRLHVFVEVSIDRDYYVYFLFVDILVTRLSEQCVTHDRVRLYPGTSLFCCTPCAEDGEFCTGVSDKLSSDLPGLSEKDELVLPPLAVRAFRGNATFS